MISAINPFIVRKLSAATGSCETPLSIVRFVCDKNTTKPEVNVNYVYNNTLFYRNCVQLSLYLVQ